MDTVRVIDFTRILAGPYVTRSLCAMGAEVIKIEEPFSGDVSRHYEYKIKEKLGGYYLQLNAGKKSMSLNLKSPTGVQIVKELTKVSDVVVENFRPGTMARLGLGYESLKAVNPRIIMCSISGFGQYGPYAGEGAQGIMAEALSGAMEITGAPGEPPPVFGVPVADINGGVHALAAICAALYFRERTGVGQYIDIALLDCIFGMHEFAIQLFTLSGGKDELTRYGYDFPRAVPYGVFTGQDGYVVIAAGTDANWVRLTRAMGRPELGRDPRYVNNEKRVEHREEVLKLINDWVYGFASKDQALAILKQEGVPNAPVKTIREAIEDPQLNAREMLVDVDHPISGKVKMPNVPFKFSETMARFEGKAATLGEHTREVLTHLLGYDDGEVNRLREEGIAYWEE
jgi:crotonobetainyl-CoA:carnitine CoA-transferase CaiB-like acyl-CoA transferase